MNIKELNHVWFKNGKFVYVDEIQYQWKSLRREGITEYCRMILEYECS